MRTQIAKSDCGCEFEISQTGQIFHWCPIHKAAPALYEALEQIIAEGIRCLEIAQQDRPVREIYDIDGVDRIARQAFAKAREK